MNGAKIDEDGNLWLERAGNLKEQYCPKGKFGNCRDHCPLFSIEASNDPNYIDISLCEGKHYLVKKENFTDERRGN